MQWFVLVLLVVAVLVAGVVWVRRRLRQWREREKNRARLREELQNVRQAVEQFEKTTAFDEQIRLLADITRYCSKGFRLFPDHSEIMDIARFCEDERRKLTQQWAVSESLRLMKFVEGSENLRVKAGRADQVVESLKMASRYLFPHEQVTAAMRAVTQYQEALEGLLELPEEERAEALEGLQSLLDPYFRIMEELKRENQELARVPWPGEQIRQRFEQLQRL